MEADFKDIYYDPATIRFPIGGNKIGVLHLLARIPLREKTKKELKAEKEDYLRAKEIYDAHINKGQKFKAIGEDKKGTRRRYAEEMSYRFLPVKILTEIIILCRNKRYDN